MATIYRGIAFPFIKGVFSTPNTVTDDQLVLQSIIQIITTARGERVMRPDFGTGAYGMVFENNDDALSEMVKLDLKSSIAKFEPRAIVLDVAVTKNDEGNALLATISFVVSATKNQYSVNTQLPQ